MKLKSSVEKVLRSRKQSRRFSTNIVALSALMFVFLLTGLQNSEAQIIPPSQKTRTTIKKSRKRHKRKKRPAKIDGYIRISSYYDDNVFGYSDSDRTVFSNQTKPERFPIDQIDDVVTSVAARGDIVWSRKRRSNWRLRFRYDASLYQSNTFRNNNQFGVELRRKKRHSQTELSVRWTPNFYLRHLFWSSLRSSTPRTLTDPTYAPANLSKVGFYLEREQRLARRLYGRITLGYIIKNYGAPFDERDNNTFSVAARLRKVFTRRFEAYVGGFIGTVNSSASDYNVVGISDVGNTETGFKGGFELKLDKRGRFSWSESFAYAHQSYSTSDVADVFHFNRSDNEAVWRNRLTWRVHPHWQPRVFYTLRSSSTNVQPGVSDVGAFSSNRFGVQILHYF